MTHDSRWYARAFDATYLEVYAHRDDAEAERVTRHLLEPLGLAGRRVLDLACGAGRHARALARRRAHVVGVDLSRELLRRARRDGVDAHVALVRGDMLRVPFRDASFDLVLSMFTSFGYFADALEDVHVLREVRRVLRETGTLVLDLFNAARVRSDLVPETRRRVGRFEVCETRRLDDAGERVIKDIELRDGDATHRYREIVRLWSRAQIESALESCALSVQRVWGDYDGGDFDSERSPRLVLCARARANA